MQKARFEIYSQFIQNETQNFFYHCTFDVRYTIVSDTGVSFFDAKSDWLIKLILRFSVYHCHGNIDLPKNYILSNFNLIPIPGVNFTLIRVC